MKFYSTSLYLVTFSTIISVIVLNIARNKHGFSVPRLIKTQLDGTLGKVLGLKHAYTPPIQQQQRNINAEELRESAFEDHTTSEDHHMIQPLKSIISQQDWILFATAIDRVSFFVFGVVYAILAIVDSV